MSLKGKVKGASVVGSVSKLKGIHGYSAYEIAVMHGFEGTEEEWLESLENGINYISQIEETDEYCKYEISYADGKIFEFVVQNGAKGDKGDKGDPGEACNPVTGAETGAIVTFDDVSPKEHLVKVGLRTKNLLYFTADKSITNYGISAIWNKGASAFVLNGTATASQAFPLVSDLPLKAGTYTVSITGLNANAGNDRIYVNCNGTIVANYVYDGVPKTFTINEDASTVVQFVYANGTVYDNKTVTMQIEEGTTATAFTPYVGGQQIQVKTFGKNLIPYPYQATTLTANGITFTDNGNGTITANGTATADAHFYAHIYAPTIISSGTYFFSGLPLGTTSATAMIRFNFQKGGVEVIDGGDYGSGAVVNAPNGIDTIWIDLRIVKGATVSNFVFEPQLEYGNTATAYEPYKEGQTVTTTLAEGATLQSISPNMTVLTDTSGVQIEADYQKDINKVIEKLTNAIIALGGNV